MWARLQMILFNPYTLQDKKPFGAVPNGTALDFRARVLRSVFGYCELHLQKDGEDEVVYPMTWNGLDGEYDNYTCHITIETEGLYFYRITMRRDDFVFDTTQTYQQTVYEKGFDTPHWIRGGLYYHIFVDRFARGKETPKRADAVYHTDWREDPEFRPTAEGEILNCDFFGGNLDGIRQKLPYLHKLSVTALYLSPIFKAYSNHKYDTGDYQQIDPSFGTFEDLERLITEAKSYGIRIICDGVFNHTGSDSRYFNLRGTYDTLGAAQSAESPYRDWYYFNPDGTYQSWWGIYTLPTVKKGCKGFESLILGEEGVAPSMVRRGIGGWRLDVADELSDGFLDCLRTVVKQADPEALIIGEVWEDASNKIAYGNRRCYFLGKQLDSVMNYPFQNAICDFVKSGQTEPFYQTIMSVLDHYPSCVVNVLMNTLGTHDTPRILTRLGMDVVPEGREVLSVLELDDKTRQNAEKRLKMAFLIQFTPPGVRCIYYGDEGGREGGRDPFNRRTYPWGEENQDLLSWVQYLGKLRKKYSAFGEGKLRFLYAQDGVLLYERQNEKYPVIIGVNRGDTTIEVSLDGFRRIYGRGKRLQPDSMGIWTK